MKIDILTLFPHMFDGFLSESIIKRAIDDKKVFINIHDIRDYSKDPHKKVDDLRTDDSFVILMTPQGVKYNQKMAYDFTAKKHIIIICGHYEGFDERIRTLCDMEVSIGDFVLTGGELPSMVITDSVVRLIDGVINDESHKNDSFNNNLLDYPVYTRPVSFRGMDVPEVLLSGHHENIRKYRLEEQIKRTRERRPDLLEVENGKE